MRLAHSTRQEEARPGHGEDKIATIRLSDRTVFIVADGAGGVPGGADATESICKSVAERCSHGRVADWPGCLARIDREMSSSGACGLAAAVVIEISDGGHPAAGSGVRRARRRSQAQEWGVAKRRRDRAGRAGLTRRPGGPAARLGNTRLE